MKIRRLKLNYGPFTDFCLEIPESPGFHLLYGPNEAGKTSLLRALKALFFKMPLHPADAFLHEGSQLRIEAVILGRDGSPLTVVRRKGKKSLFRLDGSPLDESYFLDFCGGIDQASFENIFALDHEILRRGGEEILSGGGEVGQSLFEAGAGMTGLRRMLADLDKEADRLFKPGGSLPAVNAALRQFADAKKKTKESGALTEEWHKLDQERKKAEEDLEALNREMLACVDVLERMKRIQGCRARLAERSRLERELKNYGDLPELPPGCAELRESLVRSIREAEIQIAEASAGMARLESETQALEINEAVLEREPAITALHADLGNYRSSLRDIRAREADRQANDEAALEIWRTLKPGEPLERAQEYRLSQEQSSIIASLVDEHQKLETKLEVSTQELQKVSGSIAELEARLLSLPSTVETGGLETALKEAEALGNIEERRLQAFRKAQDLRRQVEVKLKAQPLWQGSLEEFERLQLPLRETVQRLAAESEDVQGQLSSVAKDWDALQRDRERLEARLAKLAASGEIASHEQLQASRRRRDRIWGLIRQSVFEGKISLPEAQAAAPSPNQESLDAAFEKAVAQADRIADLLRTDSKRTAEYELLKSEIATLQARAGDLSQTRGEVESKRRDWEQRWQGQWTALQGKPLSPTEMSAWLARHAEIVSLAANLRDQELALQEMERQIAAAEAGLSKALQKILHALRSEDLRSRDLRSEDVRGEGEQLLLAGVERRGKAAASRLAKDLKKMMKAPGAEGDQLPLYGITDEVRARLNLSGALQKMLEAPSEPEEPLRALLSRARQCRETVSQWNSEREGIRKEMQKLRMDQNGTERQVAAAKGHLQTWSLQWSKAIAPLGLAENHSPKLAGQFLKRMDALFSLLAEGKTIERRIVGMTRIIADFKEKAAGLAARIAPDLLHAEADLAVEMMTRRLKNFSNHAATREAFHKERNDLLSRSARAELELEKAQGRLKSLIAQAGCESLEQLERTERKLSEKQRHVRELESLESQLVADAGKPVAELAAESALEDFNTLAYRISALEKTKEELDAAKIEKAKVVGDLRTRLKAIDGSEEAAAAAQDAQLLLSKIKAAALEYAKVATAADLLRKTVDSFRDRNQGPLLSRASELMPRFTLGSIVSLRVGYDETRAGKDERVILCVRPGGREVGVEGLSDGAVDQLYLALRIAAIEKHIAENQPLPLLLDDILIHYDDDRAMAVLKVLRELSESTGTQVLFFTHHLRLVEMAREATRGNVIDMRDLAPQTHRAAV